MSHANTVSICIQFTPHIAKTCHWIFSFYIIMSFFFLIDQGSDGPQGISKYNVHLNTIVSPLICCSSLCFIAHSLPLTSNRYPVSFQYRQNVTNVKMHHDDAYFSELGLSTVSTIKLCETCVESSPNKFVELLNTSTCHTTTRMYIARIISFDDSAIVLH